jgi:hypothetical protein
MSYVALALFAEGPSDHRLLQPLLQRAVEDYIAQHAYGAVEVGPMRQLPAPDGEYGSRADLIAAAALANEGAFHLLFVHADGAGDPAAARAQRVEPAKERVAAVVGTDRRVVAPVVPVRETEAWALADGDALRAVLSTRATDDDLGLPAVIEGDADPKRTLNEAVRRARGGRRSRRQRSAAEYFDLLGQVLPLESLRRLGAFNQFEVDLGVALGELGYVPEH